METKNVSYTYMMNDCILESSDSEKDLVVTLDYSLNLSSLFESDAVTQKANRILRCINREILNMSRKVYT